MPVQNVACADLITVVVIVVPQKCIPQGPQTLNPEAQTLSLMVIVRLTLLTKLGIEVWEGKGVGRCAVWGLRLGSKKVAMTPLTNRQSLRATRARQ